jgi:serine protease Do
MQNDQIERRGLGVADRTNRGSWARIAALALVSGLAFTFAPRVLDAHAGRVDADGVATALTKANLAQPAGATDQERADIAAARSLSRAFQHVAKKVEPSVVHITTLRQVDTRRSFFEAPRLQLAPGGLGSGVIMTEDGYILTNNHVVAGADELRVRLSDGREIRCELVGADPATDLAVLKVEETGLPAANFGDSDGLEVGEWVVAIGSPFGFDSSVTAGIVSAKGRSGIAGSRGGDGRYEEFIQTDAAINPGNSGGPLLNLDGQVVGINTAIITRTGGSVGLGFAIPAKMARNVMENIIASGKPQRGYLGAGGSDLDSTRAADLGLTVNTGAIIENVMPESPADKAGLRPGDVVVGFGGRPVDSFNRLRNAIAFSAPGEEVALDVVRNGERKTLRAQIADRDAFIAQTLREEPIEVLGISVRNVSRGSVPGMGDSEAAGVEIASMQRSGAAFRAGLLPGDLILAVDRQMVSSVDELKRALGASSRGTTRIDIQRGSQTGYVLIRR